MPGIARIVVIVEGFGEVSAVPILLRRLLNQVAPGSYVEVMRPIRIPRGRLVKEGELERAVQLAANTAGAEGAVLVLLDADDDCPAQLAPALLARATAARGDVPIRVVFAKREYEAWFVGALDSLGSWLGTLPNLPAEPEDIRDAKGWLSDQRAGGRPYRETIDQPSLSNAMSLSIGDRCPSFGKLVRDIESLVNPVS